MKPGREGAVGASPNGKAEEGRFGAVRPHAAACVILSAARNLKKQILPALRLRRTRSGLVERPERVCPLQRMSVRVFPEIQVVPRFFPS